MQMQEPLLSKNPNRRLQMELIINIEHEDNFDLNAINEEIFFHSKVLQNLTIKINIQNNCPKLNYKDVQNFADAIAKSTKLRLLVVEGFVETFHKTHWQSIFDAMMKLPDLETLSFKNTYIGPVGYYFIRESLCPTNKIASLDLTLTGMISEDDAESLADLLRLTTSLKSVVLGKSPMTLKWWQLLSSSLDRKNPPTLVWQPSSQKDMHNQMRTICIALQKQGYTFAMNDSIYLLGLFLQETKNFDEEWTEFKASHGQSDASKLLSPMTFLASSTPSAAGSQRIRPSGNYGTYSPAVNQLPGHKR
jgi:RNA-binding protein YhbY